MNNKIRAALSALLISVPALQGFGGGIKPELAVTSAKIKAGDETALSGERITCLLPSTAIRVQKGSTLSFRMFAANDVTSRVFRLSDGGTDDLQIAPKENRAGSRLLLFSEDYATLFSGKGKYTWNWRARARTPGSPLANMGNRQVKKISIWYVVSVNGESYTSEIKTLRVIR